MRVPLSWLRDYVDIQLTPEQLAERLTLLGMEVKDLERWGSDWQDVVVGELLSVEKHPRADRLSLTRVRVGDGEVLDVVCGATNIAPGQRVPVALPGATLPGGRRIERSAKMGVVSNGMLCSGDELHLTRDAEGIFILAPDAPLGVPLTDLFGDVVLDVDVKPNRGDALCLVGLAREVAAATGAPVRLPPIDVVEGSVPIGDRLAVEVKDPELCSRFVGRWVGGVEIRPSPDHVQIRLMAAGQRPVSNVVDASNYVMLELGKPIHTFDAAAVALDEQGRARIVVRRAEKGEGIETLDHVERELDAETLLIADPRGPLGIAGVMGGAASEVGDSTRDVIVESAIFDPVNIRRTAFRYALRSEASLRFEKGQEFRLARLGADRTARLIAEWAGGEVAAGRVDTQPDEPDSARLAFRPTRINRLLGLTLRPDEQRELLSRVEIATEEGSGHERVAVSRGEDPLTVEAAAGESLVAVVPTWRRDIAIEADVAEEIARVRGYELVPSVIPDTAMPPFRPSPLEARDAVRETLAGAGVAEVVTPALVSPRNRELFPPYDPAPVPPGEEAADGAVIVVTNPLSSQHSVLRGSLLGSLLDVVATNVRQGRESVAVFEVGKGYGRSGPQPQSGPGPEARPGPQPREWWRLGFALTGPTRPAHPSGPARPWDLDDAKGIVELLCRRLGFGQASYARLTGDPALHPGRAATVRVPTSGGWTVRAQPEGPAPDPADRPLDLSGRIGELHPALVESLELRAERIIVAELAVAGLSGGQLRRIVAAPVPRFPVVERDLAVDVADSQPAGAVADVIRRHAGPELRELRLFDVYRGAPLDVDRKSLAFRLTFRADDRTLTEADVDAVVVEIVRAIGEDVGGRLRG